MRDLKANMKIVIKALATCTAAVILVFPGSSANAQTNKPAAAKTAGKPNIVHIGATRVCGFEPLFLVDQFKVVTKGLNGEPILPTDEEFAGIEEP
jgi:hypothetical protein